MKVAVMAGTPIDTQMGVDYLTGRGIEAEGYPVSSNPMEQTVFQTSPYEQREDFVRQLIRRAMAEGCDRLFVYCNSLSGTVNFPGLAEELGITTVTPLMIYSALANRYRLLAVMAANNQSLAGIEKTIVHQSPDTVVLGYSSLKMVNEIEEGIDPAEMMRANGIDGLVKAFEAARAEALILGCTHFPYFREEIDKLTQLEVIDPADEMLELMRR